MDLNRYTPVPAISSSAAETDSKELQEEMKTWRKRMEILKDGKNYEDAVTISTNVFCNLHCYDFTRSRMVHARSEVVSPF